MKTMGMTHVQSSWRNTSSKKGTPATMPYIYTTISIIA